MKTTKEQSAKIATFMIFKENY